MSEQTEIIEAGEIQLMLRYLTPGDLPKLLDLYAEEQWGELSFCLPELLECYPKAFLGAFAPDRVLICKYNRSINSASNVYTLHIKKNAQGP